jgi:Protein of unknown function (DUF3800)
VDLAHALVAYDAGTMFYGYIDESGDARTNIRTLSCLAGHSSQLFWFEIDWNRILGKKNAYLREAGRPELSRFHATDWSTKRREFEGWSDDEKIEFIDKFIGLFYRYPVVTCSESVDKGDVLDVFPEAKERVDELSHYLLLVYIVSYFAKKLLSQERYETDEMAFIHDASQYHAVLSDTFEGLKNDIGITNRKRLASIEAKSWKDEPLLQAADLIAYENFKVIERRIAGASMRISMQRILDSPLFGGRNAMLTKELLQEFRNNADRSTIELIFKTARIRVQL